MSNATKIETVTVETVTAAGPDTMVYRVEMPDYYDAEDITAEDMANDPALLIVDDDATPDDYPRNDLPKTTTAWANGAEYVIDIEQGTDAYDIEITVARLRSDGWSTAECGNGTWNDDGQRIEDMEADLPESTYIAIDAAIADALSC